MHFICETSREDKKIIGEIESNDQFLEIIQNYIMDRYPEYTVLENISLEQIKRSEKYDNGIYLVKNNAYIQLISKSQTISESYICDFAFILCQWEVLTYNNLLSENLKENNNLVEDKIENNNNNFAGSLSPAKFQIKKFELDPKIKNPSFLITGRRSSGKSWFIRDIINKLELATGDDNFAANTLIVAPKDKENPFYANYFPDAKIIYKYDREIILEHLKKGMGCVVLDDCLLHQKLRDIGYDFSQCRIPFIISNSYLNLMSGNSDNNIDYYVFFGEKETFWKKKIWDVTEKKISTYEHFEKVFDTITGDHRAMIIDRKNKSKFIGDLIFWYKARIFKRKND